MIIEIVSFNVIKCFGVMEFFSREKVIIGVWKVCQGCFVMEGDFVVFVQCVEEVVWQMGVLQFDMNEIGFVIFGLLCEFDEVVFL